jgi:phage tail-like protein
MARCAKVDPLEKFRFVVEFSDAGEDCSEDTVIKAGFHDIQMPKRTTTKIAYREGVDADISSQSAGLSTMEDIVLSRGLLSPAANNDDLTSINGLYRWMSAVHKPKEPVFSRLIDDRRDSDSGLDEYRKTVTISILGRDGAVARQWKVYNAFPVNFVPASDLNAAEDGEKAMESLTLAYEDFEEIDPSGESATGSASVPTE